MGMGNNRALSMDGHHRGCCSASAHSRHLCALYPPFLILCGMPPHTRCPHQWTVLQKPNRNLFNRTLRLLHQALPPPRKRGAENFSFRFSRDHFSFGKILHLVIAYLRYIFLRMGQDSIEWHRHTQTDQKASWSKCSSLFFFLYSPSLPSPFRLCVVGGVSMSVLLAAGLERNIRFWYKVVVSFFNPHENLLLGTSTILL